MTTHKGLVIQLRRLDFTLTKWELIAHIESDHSQVPFENLKGQTKDVILQLHRLIHFGIGRNDD